MSILISRLPRLPQKSLTATAARIVQARPIRPHQAATRGAYPPSQRTVSSTVFGSSVGCGVGLQDQRNHRRESLLSFDEYETGLLQEFQ